MIKSERGFTLIEVIVSIFAVILMSNFIIRMFLVSAELNQKVHLTDLAGAYALQLIESFKADPIMIKTDLQKESVDPTAIDTFVMYYDADWQLVSLAEATYQLTAVWEISEDQVVSVPQTPGGENLALQGIMDFRVTVERVEKGEVTAQLVHYEAKKYGAYLPTAEGGE